MIKGMTYLRLVVVQVESFHDGLRVMSLDLPSLVIGHTLCALSLESGIPRYLYQICSPVLIQVRPCDVLAVVMVMCSGDSILLLQLLLYSGFFPHGVGLSLCLVIEKWLPGDWCVFWKALCSTTSQHKIPVMAG